jgi:hypothetical protein
MSELPPEIDISRPHPARMYDYFLGGKNHFAADRETAETVLATAPTTVTGARENRAFLGRAVRYLVAEAGIRQFLDFDQPVALITVAVLHFIQDEFKPAGILSTLLDALPSGSYLAASHVTSEHLPAEAAATTRAYRSSGVPLQTRDSGDFARMAFSGLELVPPGVVLVSEWRPDDSAPRPAGAEVNVYGGVGRKRLARARLRAPGVSVTSAFPLLVGALRVSIILTVFNGRRRTWPA